MNFNEMAEIEGLLMEFSGQTGYVIDYHFTPKHIVFTNVALNLTIQCETLEEATQTLIGMMIGYGICSEAY